jgi:hypothetical protein
MEFNTKDQLISNIICAFILNKCNIMNIDNIKLICNKLYNNEASIKNFFNYIILIIFSKNYKNKYYNLFILIKFLLKFYFFQNHYYIYV